jgi:hypothetical protein
MVPTVAKALSYTVSPENLVINDDIDQFGDEYLTINIV